jgi:hypothetical protein
MRGGRRARWAGIAVLAGLLTTGWSWRLAGAPPELGAGAATVEVGRSAPGAPGRVPPGELELRVSVARAEAVRLVMVTPPGAARRAARYDPDSQVWTARFFVDRATPPGRYDLRVDVVGRDGRTERVSLPYTIDAHAPLLSASLRQLRWDPAEFQVTVRGALVSAERTTTGTNVTLSATARHVEVRTPDGSLVTLDGKDDAGRAFDGRWTSRRPAEEVLKLRVVAVDRALGEHVADLAFKLPGVAPAQRLAAMR